MNTVKVLLVEDNPADVALTEEALKSSKLSIYMNTAENGEEALKLLQTGYTPDIILLDLNMPRMDGKAFLSIVKQTKKWASIPVVILTSSDAKEDINSTYKEHTNCYVQKPVDFDEFKKIVCAIDNFWFTVVKLPIK